MMLDAHYLDAYRLLHPAEAGFTFRSRDPHVRLDYLFLPAPSAGRLKDCRVVNGDPAVTTASDHFPILAELDMS